MIKDLSDILKNINPDIIHNIGTEREHNYWLLKLAGTGKTIVSMTGIVSICSKHYFGGMNPREYSKRSIGDLIRGDSITKQQKQFQKWGCTEQALLRESNFIMGRTTWDRAYVHQINPSAEYIHCGELLNECFSVGEWSLSCMQRHMIFVSQATYPLKGLHMLLEAMPIILSKYPDAKIVVAGGNIIGGNSLIDKIKKTSYAVYLKKLIKKNGLENCISFAGAIPAERMKELYLKCNVFVMPSAIENSPNSLGEAMSLGVPIVASYVGGIPDMVEHKKSALLYDFKETHMLAHSICSVFENDNFALNLGRKARERAKEVFNRDAVLEATINAYEKIMKRD